MKKLLYLLFAGSIFSGAAHAQDLKVTRFDLQSPASTGGFIKTNAVIENIGKKASNSTLAGYYLSNDTLLSPNDVFLKEVYLPSILAGSGDSLVTHLKLPDNLKGNFFLFVHADYKDEIKDKNKTNNISGLPIFIHDQPLDDISISYFQTQNTVFAPGTPFYASVREINNTRRVPSNKIGYFISADSILDPSDYFAALSFVQGNDTIGFSYVSFNIPANTAYGPHYVIAKADYSDTIAESNEFNNEAFIKINIRASQQDLILTSFVALYDSTNAVYPVTAGGYLYTRSDIRNAGNNDVINTTQGHFLSSDTVFSADDQLISNNYIGNLYPGQNYSLYANLKIPHGLQAGNYFLLSVADQNNQLAEISEHNNVKFLPIQVTKGETDLLVWDFNAKNTVVAAGNYVVTDLREFNQGNAYAPHHAIAYYLSTDTLLNSSDPLLGINSVQDLAPNSSAYYTNPLYIPAATSLGQYYVIAKLDYSDTIVESNESNNIKATPITIGAPSVDLSLSLLRYDSSAVSPGSLFTVGIRDINSGPSEAGYHQIRYYLSLDPVADSTDLFMGEDSVLRIYSNHLEYFERNFMVPSGLGQGTYYFIGITDFSGFVTESNESNNTSAIRLNIRQAATDLSVSIMNYDTSYVLAGQYLHPSVIEDNLGPEAANDHYIGYYLSRDAVYDTTDVSLTFSYVNYLGGNLSSYSYPQILISGSTPPGQYYLIAVADAFRQVNESDENNNVSVSPIEIRASNVDYLIASLTVSNPLIEQGTPFYPEVNVANSGSGFAPATNVGYFLSQDTLLDYSDYMLGNESVQLYGGSNQLLYPSLSVPYFYPAGTYYLIAAADHEHFANETNEYNNNRYIQITVGKNESNLVISSLTTDNNNPYPGNFAYVSATERNNGQLNAAGHHVGYFLSKDSTFDITDSYLLSNYISGLDGGNSLTLNPALYIPANVVHGYYYIIAVADYGNNVTESYEYDNTTALRVKIGNPVETNLPDLEISTVYVDSNQVQGTYLYGSVGEYNAGNQFAGNHYIGFYLSADTTVSGEDDFLGYKFVEGLAAGNSFYDYFDLLLPRAGKYFLLAVTDFTGYVTESKEYNNVARIPLNIRENTITAIETVTEAEAKISVYPNPSSGIITIANAGSADHIEVIDLNGQVLLSESVTEINSQTMDLSSLLTGVYFVKTKKDGVVKSNTKVMLSK